MKQEPHRVIVSDIRMGFWSMVVFMVKWSLASIPAFVILTVCLLLTSGTVVAFFRSLVLGGR